MSRFIISALVGGCLFYCGCTSKTESVDTPDATTPTVADVDTNTVMSADQTVPAVDSTTIDTDGTESPEADGEAKPDTAQAYLEKMQSELQGSPDQRDGVKAAIATSIEAREAFPDDENVLRASTVLLFQSLQIVDDEETLKSRRLELGRLSRLLVERNKDNLAELGNMPSILLVEESKGYIAGNDLEKALQSIEEARSNGFDQSRIFYMDPAFEPMLSDDKIGAKFKSWLSEEMETQIAAFESFPFEFKLQSLTSEEGEEVSLADFKGKPVIVDFWGTWCPPCRAALPHLVDLYEKHDGELVVLGVNFEAQAGAETYEEAKEQLAGFLKVEPLPYPCLHGENELTTQVPGFQGFPTMVFVGKDGTVQFSLTGYNPAPILETVVDRLMAM